MNKDKKIVQFLHPGTQYSVKKDWKKNKRMPWNKDAHHRKFLKAKGQFVDGDKLSDKQELCFWGEWEPDSELETINVNNNLKDFPNYIHKPILKVSSEGSQNTDPLVFGDAFYYSLCQQFRNYAQKGKQPTALKSLERGSIILFGSHIKETDGKEYFALDTVFVVGEYKDYQESTAEKDLKGFVPDDYYQIRMLTTHKKSSTISSSACGGGCSPTSSLPQKGCDSPSEEGNNNELLLRCYKGATFEKPIDGMYSFVPCKIADGNGFGRVKIKISDEISGQTQGYHFIKINATPKDLKDFWQELKQDVKKQGYELGVKFEYKREP